MEISPELMGRALKAAAPVVDQMQRDNEGYVAPYDEWLPELVRRVLVQAQEIPLEAVRKALEPDPDVDLPDDLQKIAEALYDLDRYRKSAIGADLGRAVAFELLDRVKRLPDHTREDSA